MSDTRPPLAPPAVSYALRPQIAVYSTPDVDDLARANGLRNLAHILKPWEGSVERVTLRTSTFVSHTAPVLPLLIDDSRDLVQTELDPEFLDHLTTSIDKRTPEWLEGMDLLDVGQEGDEELWKEGTIEELTPWYAYFRSALLENRPRTVYETFGHPVACIIAVSTANPEPLNAFAALYEATSPDTLFKDKPWMDPTVLRYYVVIHDLSTGPAEEWSGLLEDIRRAYGVHCAFLALNGEAASLPDSAYVSPEHRPPPKDAGFADHWKSLPSSPTLHPQASLKAMQSAPDDAQPPGSDVEIGARLNDEDVRRIKAFLREFTVQSLVPWMERNVAQWNETLAANRRGIAGRLFSAGRRYFGSRPASPSNNANPPAYDPVKGIYPYQTQEAQTRRLADFAFMICDYRLASSVYETARKDFTNDKAWRYYASATRMAGLTNLLLSTSPGFGQTDPDMYLEQAAATTAAVGGHLDELRSITLYYELYRITGDWKRASIGMARIASDIDELPSALLLEQAAMALLKSPRPARRRFALLMTLASLRYERTGSKALARRCGLQALSIYPKEEMSDWSSARNHLEQVLGRQAYNTGHAEQALQHFINLLSVRGNVQEGGDTETCQGILDDFKLAWDILGDRADAYAEEAGLKLPAPIFDRSETQISVSSIDTAVSDPDGPIWKEMEEKFIKCGFPFTDSRGKVHKAPMSLLPDDTVRSVAVGDTFHIALTARNTLDATVTLQHVELVFEAGSAEAVIESQRLDTVVLPPRQDVVITLEAKATAEGTVTLRAVTYRFNGLLACKEDLDKKGKRLHSTKAQMLTPTYDTNKSLTLKVIGSSALLKVRETMTMPSGSLLAGEIVSGSLELSNAGQWPVRNVRLLCSHPSFAHHSADDVPDQRSPGKLPNTICGMTVTGLKIDEIAPGASTEVPLTLRGDLEGVHTLSWLFVYYSGDSAKPSVCRFSKTLEIKPSLSCQLAIDRSSATQAAELLLKVSNSSIEDEVHISAVTALSPQWALGESEHPSQPALVKPKQSTLFRLPVVHDPAQDPFGDFWSFTLEQLRCLLTKQDLKPSGFGEIAISESTYSPPGGLERQSRLKRTTLQQYLSARSRLRVDGWQQQFPSLSADSISDIFPLFNPHCLDLIVNWRIPSSDRHGFHLLSDIAVSPAPNLVAKLLREIAELPGGRHEGSERDRLALAEAIGHSELVGGQCPVTVTQQVPAGSSSIDDQSWRSVTFILRNLSSSPVKCGLTLFTPQSLHLNRPISPAQWIGKLVHRKNLQPRETLTIAARLLANRGTVDVGAFELLTDDGQQQWTTPGRQLLYTMDSE